MEDILTYHVICTSKDGSVTVVFYNPTTGQVEHDTRDSMEEAVLFLKLITGLSTFDDGLTQEIKDVV